MCQWLERHRQWTATPCTSVRIRPDTPIMAANVFETFEEALDASGLTLLCRHQFNMDW